MQVHSITADPIAIVFTSKSLDCCGCYSIQSSVKWKILGRVGAAVIAISHAPSTVSQLYRLCTSVMTGTPCSDTLLKLLVWDLHFGVEFRPMIAHSVSVYRKALFKLITTNTMQSSRQNFWPYTEYIIMYTELSVNPKFPTGFNYSFSWRRNHFSAFFFSSKKLVSVTSTNFRKVPILNLHSQILSCTLIFLHNCKIKSEIGLRTGLNILN